MLFLPRNTRTSLSLETDKEINLFNDICLVGLTEELYITLNE